MGGIVGGTVLALVAVVGLGWTVVIPPGDQAAPPVPAARPASSIPAIPAPPPVRWVRVGGGEFDGPRLDSGVWATYNSDGAFGNGQRRPSAVSQSDGLLTITAKPRLNGGTSGGVTMPRGQLHGRWEFRARADPGLGYSPAVLLWPDSERFPDDGELDILESPNAKRASADSFVHYGKDNRIRENRTPLDVTKWHTYALDWLPDRITLWIDGVPTWQITDRTVIPTKPMHLCIQLDQGPAANFMPGPDRTTPDSLRLQVDWARVYKAG